MRPHGSLLVNAADQLHSLNWSSRFLTPTYCWMYATSEALFRYEGIGNIERPAAQTSGVEPTRPIAYAKGYSIAKPKKPSPPCSKSRRTSLASARWASGAWAA